MGEKILDIDKRAKYFEEVRELKEQKNNLESSNQELLQRLEGLENEYNNLKNQLHNTISLEELLGLSQKILELQNELRLKSNVPDKNNEGNQ
ncbi:MAG: hypothetical protein R2940_01030 [Syntrophotaleaceae bacterium]